MYIWGLCYELWCIWSCHSCLLMGVQVCQKNIIKVSLLIIQIVIKKLICYIWYVFWNVQWCWSQTSNVGFVFNLLNLFCVCFGRKRQNQSIIVSMKQDPSYNKKSIAICVVFVHFVMYNDMCTYSLVWCSWYHDPSLLSDMYCRLSRIRGMKLGDAIYWFWK